MKTNREILAKFVSTQGYKRNSPHKNRPVNVIPSGDITMQDVDFPVYGVDNLGNEQLMMPGGEYNFPGDYVVETPAMGRGGEMIRRADGSYSRRGLWDNIRENRGSGKKPTKEMLEQERKIKAESKQKGGAKISTGEEDLMTEYGRKITRKFNQVGDYLMPASFVNKAADMAEAKGYGFGEDSEGPLDAVRHASSAAATASRLPVPSFINSIIPGSEQKVREYGARALGALYEMYYDNPEGREMDYYNNKIGAQIGSIPGLTDEQRLKLINNALTKDKLQIDNRVPINRKQQGGMTNEELNIVDSEQPQVQGPDISAAIGEISNLIMQGDDPEEIYNMLLENGVAEEYAMDIIDEAIENLEETDVEEEEIPMDDEEMMEFEEGGITINPEKKGTFKAQATRMGMNTREAARYILNHKEKFSPEMIKKATFAQNFAKELGGEMYDLAQMKEGGIPDRYKKQGFTRLGAKRKSTRPGKKWMVLAKKGDKYKVVHGGWKGMSDYTQHRNEKRRDRFWNRMGGKDSSKAKDPFSPLYWHKRFGTWEEGGTTFTVTEENTLNTLKDNKFNNALFTANDLSDPRNLLWALPNRGLLGKVKAFSGLASGIAGATLGYSKLAKSFMPKPTATTPAAPTAPPAVVPPQQRPPVSNGSGMGRMYAEETEENLINNQKGGPVGKMTRTGGSGMGAMELWEQQYPVDELYYGSTTPIEQKFSYTNRGDARGAVVANNAIAGLGMFNSVMEEQDAYRQYQERMRNIGNTDNRYRAINPQNPFGNYTLNAGPASNFALVTNTPAQSFEQGGEFYGSDDIKDIIASGGAFDFL